MGQGDRLVAVGVPFPVSMSSPKESKEDLDDAKIFADHPRTTRDHLHPLR